MKLRTITLFLLTLLLGFSFGCAKKELHVPDKPPAPEPVVIYVPRPEPKPKPKPKPKPPEPTIEERLDAMYREDFDAWRSQMASLLRSGREDLPTKHLWYAVKEFNEGEAEQEICIEASYQYMRNRIQRDGQLLGNDQQMFHQFVEYALKKPDDRRAMLRVKSLCNMMNSQICDTLR